MEGKLNLENYCCPECKNKEFIFSMFEGGHSEGYSTVYYTRVIMECSNCKKEFSVNGDVHDIQHSLEYIPYIQEATEK